MCVCNWPAMFRNSLGSLWMILCYWKSSLVPKILCCISGGDICRSYWRKHTETLWKLRRRFSLHLSLRFSRCIARSAANNLPMAPWERSLNKWELQFPPNPLFLRVFRRREHFSSPYSRPHSLGYACSLYAPTLPLSENPLQIADWGPSP